MYFLIALSGLITPAHAFINSMMGNSWTNKNPKVDSVNNPMVNTGSSYGSSFRSFGSETKPNINTVSLAARGINSTGTPTLDCWLALRGSVDGTNCLRMCNGISYDSNASNNCKRAGIYIDQGNVQAQGNALVKCVVLNNHLCWLFAGGS